MALDSVRPRAHVCLWVEVRVVSHSTPEKTDNEAGQPVSLSLPCPQDSFDFRELIPQVSWPRDPLICLKGTAFLTQNLSAFLPS